MLPRALLICSDAKAIEAVTHTDERAAGEAEDFGNEAACKVWEGKTRRLRVLSLLQCQS